MKKLFAKIHLWLSIPFGIIIAIVCLTGSILVFETEILEFCYPSRYFVKEVKGEPLSPAALMDAARQQLPDSIKITGIRISADPERTSQLILPGKKAACFINPYTREITGIDDGKGFFMKMMRLHRWLLDEYKRDGSFAWGKAIVGYSTLALAIIIISGLVIWYPRNTKSNGVRYMWELLCKLNYAETKGIDVEKHINSELYKEALDELQKREPDNKRYKEFAERYIKYNK